MIGWRRPRAGVYLDDDRLTVVAPQGRGRVESIQLELGEQPGARLRAELGARGLDLRRVRLGLPRSRVVVKALELPAAEPEEFSKLVGFEVERHVPFAPEESSMDWATLPSRADGPQRILLAACERRLLDGALRLLGEARLRTPVVTPACHALPALVDRKRMPRRLVWVHGVGTAIEVVFVGAGRVRMSRSLPQADGEALAGEISQTVAWLKWKACEALSVSGDGADELVASPELAELAPSLTAPDYSAQAGELVEALPAEHIGASLLALALALSPLRVLPNLLPEALRPRTLAPAQLATFGMLALTGLLGLGFLFAQGYADQRHLTRLSAATRALDSEVKIVERAAAELGQKKRLLATLQSLEASALHPLPALQELSELLPKEAWLTSLSMDSRGLELTGEAAAAQQLIPLLENSAWFERTEFTSPVMRGRDKDQFRIKAAWERPPHPTLSPSGGEGSKQRPPLPSGGEGPKLPLPAGERAGVRGG